MSVRLSTTSQGPSPDPLALGYMLGELRGEQREHGRRLTEAASEHKALKARVERLESWGERAVILVILYGTGAALYLTSGSLAPFLGALMRSALGLRP